MTTITLHRANSQVAIAVALALAAANQASAQQAPGSGGELEEIIVTATKRDADIQSVPITVTAVSGAELTQMGINSILSLDKAVAGMLVNNKGNDPVIIMRGAGTAGTRDLAVPIYIDSLYRPRAGQALASYFDVERIEVLKGPQGTLFGRNTLGGLVNVIVNKPTMDDLAYGVALTAGDYSLFRAEGFVNVPMGETLAARLTGSITTADPIVENTYNDAAGLKDADEQYVRGQLKWAPTSTFDANLTISYWQDNANGNSDYAYKVLGVPVDLSAPYKDASGVTRYPTNGVTGTMQPRQGTAIGCSPGNVTYNGGRPQAGNWCTGVASAQAIKDPFRVAWDYKPQREIEETDYTLLANWDVGFATLRGNFGYFDYSELRLTDSDMSSNPALVAGQLTNSKAFQADINLTSNGDGAFRYTAGFYYYDDEGTSSNSAFLWGYTDNANPQRPYWASWLYQGNGGTKTWALYGNAEYDITDDLTVSAGLRYSDDEVNSFTKYIDPATQTSRLPKYIKIPGRGVEINGSDSHTDYRVSLQYNIIEDVMVYATNATGYIGGAIQGGNTGNLLDPTEVDSWEVGVKSTLLDGSLRLNAAYYWADYTGLTTTIFIPQGGTILAQQVPGGSTNSEGLEIDFDWAATDSLRLTGGFATTDSRFDKFNVGNQFEQGGDTVVNGRQYFDMDGKTTRYSPDYTFNLGASYDLAIGDYGRLVPYLGLFLTDSFRLSNAPYNWNTQDSYTTMDFNVTWFSPSNDFTVKAYINNLTDEEYRTEATVYSTGRAMADFALPQTWGIRVGYNF